MLQDGIIRKKAPTRATLEAVRQRLMHVGFTLHDAHNKGRYACIERRGLGAPPRLMRRDNFNAMVEGLAEEAGEEVNTPNALAGVERTILAPHDRPVCVQAYVPPQNDLRYITTYVCDNGEVSCTTFPRRFSRRYQDAPPVAGAPSNDAVNSSHSSHPRWHGTTPGASFDVSAFNTPEMGTPQRPTARRSDGSEKTDDGRASPPPQPQEVDPKAVSLDPAVKAKFRRITASIVKYVEVAHGMSLAGLVCEYVRDHSGEIYLLSVLHTEWSLASAVGSINLAHAGREGLAAPHVLKGRHPATEGESALERRFAEAQGGGLPRRDNESEMRSAGLRPVSSAGGASRGGGREAEGREPPFSTTYYDEDDNEYGDEDRSHQHSVLISAAGPVIGLDESTTQSALDEWAPQGGRAGGAPPRLSAEISSPRLLSRRTPIATVGGSALERAKEQRRSIDQPLTATPGPSSRGGSGDHNQSLPRHGATLTRQRPASAAAHRPTPAPATERLMSVQGMGSHSATVAHLSAIKANTTMIDRRVSTVAGSGSFVRSGGGGGAIMSTGPKTKARPASASAAAALRHGVPTGVRAERVAPVGGTRPGVAFGGHAGGDIKRAGRPAMRSQLGQDLDATLDELHFQSELADASAAKLAALEEDRASVVRAYNDRLASLEAELMTAQTELEEAETSLVARDDELARAESEANALEARRRELEEEMNAERGGIVGVMRAHHERERELEETLGSYERRRVRLEEELREEQAGVEALTRQLAEYQKQLADARNGVLVDAEPEPARLPPPVGGVGSIGEEVKKKKKKKKKDPLAAYGPDKKAKKKAKERERDEEEEEE